jgi:hypothetical protein
MVRSLAAFKSDNNERAGSIKDVMFLIDFVAISLSKRILEKWNLNK